MAEEAFTLDGLALHSSPYRIMADGFEHKPAKKMLEWVRNADSDGAKLLREPKHETAEITLRIRIAKQATKDAAQGYVGAIVDKLQEAERQSAGGRGRGLPLVWTPADGTFTGTFYVLAGEVEVPKDFAYLHREPIITAALTCSPWLYGAEVTTATTTSSLPLVTMTVADVPGDGPAEMRLIVTDAAGQSRDYVCVGLENFYYDAATALLATSAGFGGFVTTGFAGSLATRSGSYATNTVRATLSTTPVAVCSSAELTHKGTFRNFFRLWPSSTGVSVRIAWRQGRDQWTTEPWQTAPFEDAFWEVDLGQSKVRPALLGTQTWQWRIEAKSTVAGDTLDVDFHALVPSGEGYGKARNVFRHETPTSFLDQDSFGGMTAGVALNGRVAPIGGDTWTSTGSAPDLIAIDGPGSTDETIGRTGASQTARQAMLASHTNAAMEIRFRYSNIISGGARTVLIARVAGSADVEMELIAGSSSTNFTLAQITSGGAYSVLATSPLVGRLAAGGWYRMLLVANGAKLNGYLLTDQGSLLTAATATTTTTAAGTWGFLDANGSTTAVSRYYTQFSIYTPTVDAAIFANQSAEFRSYGDDPVLREDSTGTYWGRPPEARGGRLWLPPKGTANRTTRVAVLARRADIETQALENVTDSTSVAVAYRPRFLVIPRQA